MMEEPNLGTLVKINEKGGFSENIAFGVGKTIRKITGSEQQTSTIIIGKKE